MQTDAEANSMSPAPSSSPEESHPLLIVISGPSGVGKDAVVARMKELRRGRHFMVTATTRPRREGERDGVDYVFQTTERFRRMIERDELLEWAEVYGHLYGVPRAPVARALSQGRDVVVKIDVQGAATIRRLLPDALLIFLAPPDEEELSRRLASRKTESSETLSLRSETAAQEMRESASFDYVVVNRRGQLDAAVQEIEAIVDRERRRAPPRRVVL